VETDSRFQPLSALNARNSSTSSKVADDKSRCRLANHSRNFDVFHRCDRMEIGESPCSFAMNATKSSSSSAKRARGGDGIVSFPWKRNHFFAT
jgi:hypothetical protein